MHRSHLLLAAAAVAAAIAVGASLATDGRVVTGLTPKASFALPPELAEVSGLTAIDDRVIACVQDELGEVFYVDVREGRLVRRTPFGEPGDYEGIARVGETLWVLRSDGELLELEADGDRLRVRRRERLGLDAREFEGLCHDPRDDLLLVALKERNRGSERDRSKRRVYRFDPVRGRHVEGSAVRTTIDAIVADAAAAGFDLPDLQARFSAVATSPDAARIYTLSAKDGVALAFSREHRLVTVIPLDARAMPQPEGMTFLPGGDLVVASEGGNGLPPRIQVFDAADVAAGK